MLPAFPDPTTYDEAARYLLVRAGAGLLGWLLRSSPERVRFDGWIQSQLTLPGVKQRLCDGIARLADLERGGLPFAALVEIQTRPDATTTGRLLLAGGLCSLLLKPAPLPGDRFELLAVVVNLTGRGNSARHMVLGNAQWTLVPCELNVETLDAGTVLDDIVAGRVPGEVLALIPLMNRGSEDAIIARWLDVAGTDADAGRRGDYSLALVFSEAVRCRDKWEIALKGFNMIESPLVREWKAAARIEGKIEGKLEGKIEGKLEGKAEALMRVLSAKHKGEAEQVGDGIRACRDPEALDRWLDVALATETLAEFRQQTGL
jgi:hypothetical protein